MSFMQTSIQVLRSGVHRYTTHNTKSAFDISFSKKASRYTYRNAEIRHVTRICLKNNTPKEKCCYVTCSTNF